MHVRSGDNPKQNCFKRLKNYKTTKQFVYIIISCFLPTGASVKEAYSTLKILKIQDFISLQNALCLW